MSDYVSPPTLDILCDELREVVEWDQVAVSLKVPFVDIKRIEAEFSELAQRKMHSFQKWLNQTNTVHSWRTVADAVEKVNPAVAEHIRTKYATVLDQVQSISRYEIQVIDQKGEKANVVLEKDIVEKIINLEERFAMLVSKTLLTLEKRPDLLLSFYRYLRIRFQTLPDETNVTYRDLFGKLEDHWHYLKFRLLQTIIHEFLFDTDLPARIQEYQDDVAAFKNSSKVKVLINMIKTKNQVVLGVNTIWLDVTLKHFEFLMKLFLQEYDDDIVKLKYSEQNIEELESEIDTTSNIKTEDTEKVQDGYIKLLDKAVEEGYVKTKWTRFSISGPPGTGKSSFLRLLFNEPPPNSHDSTPVVATHETRRVEITTAVKSGEECSSSWNKIKLESILTMIAQGIKDKIRRNKSVPTMQDKSQPSKLEQLEQPLEGIVSKPVVVAKEKNQKSRDSSQLDMSSSLISQEILHLMQQVPKSEELYQSHWIYTIDTGGQAAFLDIAPALLRCNSVNIVTHKLTENLTDKAKFYFSVKGKVVGVPVQRQLTNLQLIEASCHSLSSVDSSNLPKYIYREHFQEPHLLILGTFYDELLKADCSGAILSSKNADILLSLKQYENVLITYRKNDIHGNEVIFPINTIGRHDHEINLANKVRDKICQHYIEAEIPVRWFMFQLELVHLQKNFQTSIINKSKCFEIGKALKMGDFEVEAALMYYHDLTIILYFHRILPNVVFLHPQPIFDKLSDLISISFADANNHLDDQGICIPPGAYEELKNKGTFTRDLLTSPSSHLSQGFSSDFSADDFLMLMGNLHILASLPEQDKFFLPTVLPTTSLTESIGDSFKNNVHPLILIWDMKPLPQGIFPALIVKLLHHEGSQKFFLPASSHQHYRNVIRLCTDAGDVLLVDSIYWLEVYYSGPSSKCFAIREVVHKGIGIVMSDFNYVNIKSPEERFYCKLCSNTTSEHFCRLDEHKKILTCCDSSETSSIDIFCQQPWFNSKVCMKGDLTRKRPSQPSIEEVKPKRQPIKCDISETFREKSADLCDIIEGDPLRIVNKLNSCKLVSPSVQKDVTSMTGTAYEKANKIVAEIQRQLDNDDNPVQFLTNFCDFLIKQENKTLKAIGTEMKSELDKTCQMIPDAN